MNQVTEIAIVIFFRKKGVQRKREKIISIYVDGELFEYNENAENMEMYIEGFSDGITFQKPDGSVQFIRGTAQLLDQQEPPIQLDEVVTRDIEWERDSSQTQPEVSYGSRFNKVV